MVKVSLDNVQHLGTFVELETHASEKDLNRARTALEHLAHRLGLENPERRSYLELYFAYLRSLPFEDLPPLPPIT
ncbi:hypothetical protein HRbin36_02783 [bacterium HR36]|nr:hypothetical protein HRbin36_02783 [bacterium HR36]